MMSPEFREIFFQIGACHNECGCGRINFGGRAHWTWEEGEYEGMQEMAKNAPDRYVYHKDDDGVRVGEGLNGVPIVEDCPCGMGDIIEQFWWDRCMDVTRYLKARAKREAEDISTKYLGGSSAAVALEDLAKLSREAARRAVDAHKRLTGSSP